MRTLYEILGVTPHATQAELKAAWRRAAMKWHPDRNRGREHHAQAEFQRINDAYAALTNPLRRAEYDLMLNTGPRRLAGKPAGRWRRLLRDAQRTWLRLPRGDKLLYGGRRVQRLTRSQWLMGIGVAMLAAVLLADAAIDDAPLRSNFVSRPPHPRHLAAAKPTTDAPAHPEESIMAAQAGTANRADSLPGAAFPTSDGAGTGEPDAPTVVTTVMPGDDPGLDEVHASLAEWRAAQAAAHDGAHGRSDAGAQPAHHPGASVPANADVNSSPSDAPAPVVGNHADAALHPVASGLATADRAATAVTDSVAHAAHTVRSQVHEAGAALARGADVLAQASSARAIPRKASAHESASRPTARAAPPKRSAGPASRPVSAHPGADTGKSPPAEIVHRAPPAEADHHAAPRENVDALAPYGFAPGAWQYNGGAGS